MSHISVADRIREAAKLLRELSKKDIDSGLLEATEEFVTVKIRRKDKINDVKVVWLAIETAIHNPLIIAIGMIMYRDYDDALVFHGG